jgi:multiple sugar transport system permease protein
MVSKKGNAVVTSARLAGRSRRRSKAGPGGERPGWGIRLFASLVLLAALVYFVLPVYWLIVASTKTTSELYSSPGFAFTDVRLFDNLRAISEYDGGIFWRWMLNSAIYSGLGAALMTGVSVMTGYALAVYRFRFRSLVIGIVAASMLVPQTVIAQPIYLLVVEIGLNNTYWGVLLPSIVYPFGVLLAFVFAQQSIPREVIEAARLDGANEFRTFASIGVRLMVPGSMTILLFAFIGTWNSYLLPLLVLNDVKLMPVTVGLSGWNQASITIPELQSLTIVGALLSVVPIIIVFVTLQRYWKSGLAVSGSRF